MDKIKSWIIDRKQTIIIALAVLIGGYYMYLTHVSTVFEISETYYATDGYSSIIMKFDGSTLSTYLINPDSETIAIRTDYKVGYRTYTKDIIGNFWSDDGLEPLGLRGSHIAGRLYAECVGSALWLVDEDMVYYNQDDILDMEDAEDTSYSFGSHFSLKDETLRVYDYVQLDLQRAEDTPAVEAEIMRLIDSLCPPEFY